MDFFIQRREGIRAIRAALAEAFRAPVDDLEVAWLRDLIRNPTGVSRPIRAEVSRTRGDFQTLVKLDVAARYATSDRVGFARLMSSQLGTDLLIPSPDRNPYSYLLVCQSGEVRRVDLDAESMDEREEYRLAR